jgi:hypothetical protein
MTVVVELLYGKEAEREKLRGHVTKICKFI